MALQPIDLCRTELFTAQYLSHRLKLNVPSFHRDWYRAFNDKSIKYLCIEAMRGGAKTTVMENCALHDICEGHEENVTLVSRASGTTGTATLIMGHIKSELETNALMIQHYGLQRGAYWGEDRLQVVRGDGHTVNFWSVGKRSSIRGKRGTVIIDDPQNWDDCRSETVLTRDEEWLLTDVIPVAIGDQRIIFIGTPISPLSLLCKVKDLPGFTVKSFPIENPNYPGVSVWPEQYSNERLAELRAIMGVDNYAAEYLCQPRVSGSPVFRAEWFKSYDPDTEAFRSLLRKGVYTVVAMDCAESKSDQADNTAYVVLSATMDPKPDIYVLDCQAGHWTTKEGAERVLSLFDRHQQHKTLVESRVKHPIGDAMIVEIRERERIYGKHVNLYPIKPERDKVSRALAVQSVCQEGRVYVNRHDKEQQALLSELTMFTDGTQHYRDDRVDALVYALSEIKQRGSIATGPRVPTIVLPGVRSPYTGRV